MDVTRETVRDQLKVLTERREILVFVTFVEIEQWQLKYINNWTFQCLSFSRNFMRVSSSEYKIVGGPPTQIVKPFLLNTPIASPAPY